MAEKTITELEQELATERRKRKHAEEALRSKTMKLSEANDYLSSMTKRLQFALFASRQMVWEYTVEDDCYYLFTSIQETNSKVTHKGNFDSVVDSIHEDDRAEFLTQWQNHMYGKRSSIDISVRRYSERAQRYCWTLIRGKRVEDKKSGKVTKVVGIFKDIDVQYNKNLTFQTLSDVFTGSAQAGFIFNYSTNCLVTTDSFYKELGIEKYQCLEKTIIEMLPLAFIKQNQIKNRTHLEAQIVVDQTQKIDCHFTLPSLLQGDAENSEPRHVVCFFNRVRNA